MKKISVKVSLSNCNQTNRSGSFVLEGKYIVSASQFRKVAIHNVGQLIGKTIEIIPATDRETKELMFSPTGLQFCDLVTCQADSEVLFESAVRLQMQGGRIRPVYGQTPIVGQSNPSTGGDSTGPEDSEVNDSANKARDIVIEALRAQNLSPEIIASTIKQMGYEMPTTEPEKTEEDKSKGAKGKDTQGNGTKQGSK